MTRETKRKVSTAIRYTLLILVGFIMVYPLGYVPVDKDLGPPLRPTPKYLPAHGFCLRTLCSTGTAMPLRAMEARYP